MLVMLSQCINTVFGGYPDEMLSARAYRCKWKLRHVIDLIFFWDKNDKGERNHCEQAYLHEMNGFDLPEEYRKCRECFNKEGV